MSHRLVPCCLRTLGRRHERERLAQGQIADEAQVDPLPPGVSARAVGLAEIHVARLEAGEVAELPAGERFQPHGPCVAVETGAARNVVIAAAYRAARIAPEVTLVGHVVPLRAGGRCVRISGLGVDAERRHCERDAHRDVSEPELHFRLLD